MTTDTLEQCVKKYNLRYYKYDEFNKIEVIGGGLVENVKEILYEIKLYHKVNINDVMIKFYGISKPIQTKNIY
ncbi:unnamed protein product [Rhizophagus irregularis]|nr:unnamed protein product [Rhizophagus irregularis]